MARWKPGGNSLVHSAWNKRYKALNTFDVDIAYYLDPYRRCIGRAIIFQDSVGLSSTGYPFIGEKSQFSNSPKQDSDQNENSFWLIGILKWEYQHSYKGILL